MKTLLLSFFGAALLLLNRSAHAAEFFIAAGDSAALKTAINTANANNQNDTITLTAGDYNFTAADNSAGGLPNGLPAIQSDGGRTLTIIGNGARLRRTGGNFFRFLFVNADARLNIHNLILFNGWSVGANGTQTGANGMGGAIYNAGGLTLNACTFRDSVARGGNASNTSGVGGAGMGGAIYNDGGSITATDCLFDDDDQARGGAGGNAGTGGAGRGGAIYSDGGTLTLTGGLFDNGRAVAGAAKTGGGGQGGGIWAGNGAVVSLTSVTFNGCDALGADSQFGGMGAGGAVYGGEESRISLTNCTLTANVAGGGLSGQGAEMPTAGHALGGAVYTEGAEFTLVNCTLSGNLARGGFNPNLASNLPGVGGSALGGAIFTGGAENYQGTLSVTDCVLNNNQAQGGAGNAYSVEYSFDAGKAAGGAIANGGEASGVWRLPAAMTLTRCAFTGNTAIGGGELVDINVGGGDAGGGALSMMADYPVSTATLIQCVFTQNSALGGLSVDDGGMSFGGAILTNCDMSIEDCTLEANLSRGGTGYTTNGGGYAFGGGLANRANTILTRCRINGNRAEGSHGGSDAGSAHGGGILNEGALTLDECAIRQNVAEGGDSDGVHCGGVGSGGGIRNTGTLIVFNSVIHDNSAYGGDGGEGLGESSPNMGEAWGGGIANASSDAYFGWGGTIVLTNVTISNNTVRGGSETRTLPNPAVGNRAFGGGIANGADLTLMNCTLRNNAVYGGAGLSGGATGGAFGGGIYNIRGEAWVGSSGLGQWNGTLTLRNTIVADSVEANIDNTGGSYDPPGSYIFSNYGGTMISEGYNLSSDNTGPNTATDTRNTNPLLGPLQDNGGLTFTHALLPGSPALDRIPGTPGIDFPATDQRGIARPQGTAADIGAYEAPVLTATVSGALTLESIDPNAVAQSITFTFRPSDNSGDVVRVVAVAPNGQFTIANLPRKNYTLHIKGAKWLAKNLPVNATGGNVSGLTALLPAGDANDDNAVDVLDLDLLIQTFDKCQGDGGFLTGADFNADGCVDVLDLDLLIRNFDQTGDA